MSDNDEPASTAFTVRCKSCGNRFGVTVTANVEGGSKAVSSEFDRRRRRQLSKLDRDPEVAEFACKLDKTHELNAVVAAIRERFGEDRTPARTTLHRYLQKARRVSANTAA